MVQRIGLATLVVRDYDEALAFFVDRLGFEVAEDEPLEPAGKRWVVVAPPGGGGARLLLARADGDAEAAVVGRQAAGRVAFFLETDDFARDHAAYAARGVRFLEEPRREPYGTVAIFEDVYGNEWDLIEPRHGGLPAGHGLDRDGHVPDVDGPTPGGTAMPSALVPSRPRRPQP